MRGFSSRALNYLASMFTGVQSINCWGRLPAETSVLKGLSLSPKGSSQLVLKRLSEASSTTLIQIASIGALVRPRPHRRLPSVPLLQRVSASIHSAAPGRSGSCVGTWSLFLSSVSEVDLAIRLHELGLLPENCRQRFVATVISYAIEGEDLYALESLRIQSIFTPAELSAFRDRVRAELIPSLGDVRLSWQSNRSSDQRPDEQMDPLLESFSAMKQEFADDPEIVSKIENEIQLARAWIAEKTEDEPKEDRQARTFGDVDSLDNPAPQPQARGIFDDVDE